MTFSKRTEMLLDLPCLINDRHYCRNTDIIIDNFVNERDTLPSHEYLKPFVERWKNLWLLKHPNDDHLNNLLSEEEVTLLNEDYDEEEVFMSLVDEDFWISSAYIGSLQSHIVMPVPARWVLQTSTKFNCGSDHIFVKMFLDPYGIDTACVNGSGDTRLELIESVMES